MIVLDIGNNVWGLLELERDFMLPAAVNYNVAHMALYGVVDLFESPKKNFTCRSNGAVSLDPRKYRRLSGLSVWSYRVTQTGHNSISIFPEGDFFQDRAPPNFHSLGDITSCNSEDLWKDEGPYVLAELPCDLGRDLVDSGLQSMGFVEEFSILADLFPWS